MPHDSQHFLVLQGARHLVRNMPMRDLVRHFGPDEQHLLAALVDHATEGLGAKKPTQEAFKNHVAMMADHQKGE